MGRGGLQDQVVDGVRGTELRSRAPARPDRCRGSAGRRCACRRSRARSAPTASTKRPSSDSWASCPRQACSTSPIDWTTRTVAGASWKARTRATTSTRLSVPRGATAPLPRTSSWSPELVAEVHAAAVDRDHLTGSADRHPGQLGPGPQLTHDQLGAALGQPGHQPLVVVARPRSCRRDRWSPAVCAAPARRPATDARRRRCRQRRRRRWPRSGGPAGRGWQPSGGGDLRSTTPRRSRSPPAAPARCRPHRAVATRTCRRQAMTVTTTETTTATARSVAATAHQRRRRRRRVCPATATTCSRSGAGTGTSRATSRSRSPVGYA